MRNGAWHGSGEGVGPGPLDSMGQAASATTGRLSGLLPCWREASASLLLGLSGHHIRAGQGRSGPVTLRPTWGGGRAGPDAGGGLSLAPRREAGHPRPTRKPGKWRGPLTRGTRLSVYSGLGAQGGRRVAVWPRPPPGLSACLSVSRSLCPLPSHVHRHTVRRKMVTGPWSWAAV